MLPDYVLPWLDATYVLTAESPRYPPLMSAGGTLGTSASGDTSINFMQNLAAALNVASNQSGKRQNKNASALPQAWLAQSLFGDDAPLTKGSVGQFNPGGVGGPNATTGFEAESLVNPWDFVLMIEGALIFAGAPARRLTTEAHTKATFPFTVDASGAGYGTSVDKESTTEGSRAELWVPLWGNPAMLPEVSHLFSEGRATIGKRPAQTGSDFARAVIGLGVERGVSSFQRFGFVQRTGLDGVIAAPLGRLRVREDADTVRRANLLLELDDWLQRLRSVRNAPAALQRSVREIDRAILEFCAAPPERIRQARLLQEILIALGRAERRLSTSHKSLGRFAPRPLAGLSLDWLREANDDSPEFRLAAALAFIQGQGKVGSIRVNLEPVVWKGYWDWAEDDTSAAWREGDPRDALAAVLERRCLEARMNGGEPGAVSSEDGDDRGRLRRNGLPLEGKVAAPLAHLEAFLLEQVDNRRMADLLLPLSALDWRGQPPSWGFPAPPPTLPYAYCALKLLFLPWEFKRCSEALAAIPIRHEPAVLPLLRAGRGGEALRKAESRLKASGLIPIPLKSKTYGHKLRDIPPGQENTLAAALLLPLRPRDVWSPLRYQDAVTIARFALGKAEQENP